MPGLGPRSERYAERRAWSRDPGPGQHLGRARSSGEKSSGGGGTNSLLSSLPLSPGPGLCQ